VTIPVNYISTKGNIIGFQFFLKGLPSGATFAQTIGYDTDGVGSAISGTDITFDVNTGAAATEIDFEMHALYPSTVGYDVSNGIFIIGHMSTKSTGTAIDPFIGLPSSGVATPLVTFTITDTSGGGHIAGMSASDLYIETSPSFQDTPENKHPLLVRWPFDVAYSGSDYLSGGTEETYAEWMPDVDFSSKIDYDDVRGVVNKIADSYTRLYNSTDNLNGTWEAKFDSDYDGLINIKDVCTVITEIITNGDRYASAGPHPNDSYGYRLGGEVNFTSSGSTLKSVRKTSKVLAEVVCQDNLEKRSCVPCPCPDEIELRDDETENVSGLFISDYQIVNDPSSLGSSTSAVNFVDEDGNFILDRYGSTINTPNNLDITEQSLGVITISYYSDSNIDGYWLKLGNFRDLNNVIGRSGIQSLKSDNSSECGKRNWSEYIGRDTDSAAAPPNQIIDIEESEKIRTHHKIAFGFANRVFDYIDSDSEPVTSRVSGSHSVPKTPGKRSKVLTKIIVNPASFEGEPTLESFRLVTNDTVTTPHGGWTGDSSLISDSLIGQADLDKVIEYAQAGAISTGLGASSRFYTDADNNLNAENDSNPLDIVDVLTVYNHIVENGNDNALVPGSYIPSDIITYVAPASIATFTATAPACGEAGEGIITLNWSGASGAEMFTIYRGTEGEFTNDPLYKGFVASDFLREQALANAGRGLYELDSQNIKFEELVVLTDESTTSYQDLNPPQNTSTCGQSTKITFLSDDINDYIPQESFIDVFTTSASTGATVEEFYFVDGAGLVPATGVVGATQLSVNITTLTTKESIAEAFRLVLVARGFEVRYDTNSTNTLLISSGNKVDSTKTGMLDSILTLENVGKNPEILYILVASNKHGEVTNKVRTSLPSCAIGPEAKKLTISATINTEKPFDFIGAVTDKNAPKPYGTCDKTTTFCEELTFEIMGDISQGRFNNTLNKSGNFIYYPPVDEAGIFNVNYKVSDSRGCSATNSIEFVVRPTKVSPTMITGAPGTLDYGKVNISWDRARGRIWKYEIYRDAVLIKTIEAPSGGWGTDSTSLSYTDSGATLPDRCSAVISDTSAVYKIKTYAFMGASDSSITGTPIEGTHYVTSESDETTITFTDYATINNPTFNAIAQGAIACDPNYPELTVSWNAPGAGTPVRYEVWRSLPSESTYKRITTVAAATTSYVDNPPQLKGCTASTYQIDYRIVALDSEGIPSGNPNDGTWGSGVAGDPCSPGGDQWTSPALSYCPNAPIGKTETIDVCAGKEHSGTLFGSPSHGGTITFAEVGGPTAGLTIAAGGAFTYNATSKSATDPNVTFDYEVTEAPCSSVSLTYTITLDFVDCDCNALGEEKNYVIRDIVDIKNEIGTTTLEQPPFSLTRRGGQTLRKKSAYVVTSGTNIGCSEDGALLAPLSISGLSLWVDPSDPATVHYSLGNIHRIDDKSGNGHYFKSPATINDPGATTIGATTPLNGIDIVPGGNQKYLLGYDSSNAAISFGSLISPTASTVHTYDLYMVVVPNAAGDVNTNYAGGDVPDNNSSIITQYPGDGSGNWWGVFYNSNNEFELFQRAAASGVLWNEPIVLASGGLDSVNVVQFSHDDPTGTSGLTTPPDHTAAGSLNGGAQTSQIRARLERGIVGGVGTLADYQLTIGMDRTINTNFDGQIGEIIVYNRVLTAEERAQITTYLVDKWST